MNTQPTTNFENHFEIKACRKLQNTKETLIVGTAKTLSQAKKFIRECLPQIVETLTSNNFASLSSTYPLEEIEFEIINTEKAIIKPTPITNHPTVTGITPPINVLWYDPTSHQTLKDPQHYTISTIGINHYHITSKEQTYAIDMEACNGNGICTCMNFEKSKSPFLKKNEVIQGNLILFKHQDCPHLRHIKFIINKPFGQTIFLTQDQLNQH